MDRWADVGGGFKRVPGCGREVSYTLDPLTELAWGRNWNKGPSKSKIKALTSVTSIASNTLNLVETYSTLLKKMG